MGKEGEKNNEGKTNSILVPCVVRGLSLGDGEYTFVEIAHFSAWPKRELVTVNEQPHSGERLSATVLAEIEEENDNFFIVNIPVMNHMVRRLKLSKKTNKVLVLRRENVYCEEFRR